VTGPAGQVSIDFNVGYGFTAIIVAFLGRLHPLGILLAGLLMALTYIGGEMAQLQLGLPGAVIQLFQGMLLFFPPRARPPDGLPRPLAPGGGRLMDLSTIDPLLLLASLMVAATPILLAAVGELVVERAGVLNLGVEGMMITGAVVGFISAVTSGSAAVGFLGAAAGGAGLSLLFAVLVLWLRSNQVATGLALTLFGLGLASLLGQPWVGVRAPEVRDLDIPLLGDIPVLGPILFQHDLVVYGGLAVVLLVWLFLHRTRAGLTLRAVGENHDAAHALGTHVLRVRLLAILFGGACAGLGGAYLSLVRVPQWTEGVTAGAGWIALAIVVFASWRPLRLLLGAWLFGGISVLQLNLQAANAPIPVELLSMAPYLVTILVLVLISSGRGRASLAAPGSLGQPFHASR
jgi:simple sugar transport system permease protein